ncbi:MAG: succinate dehydrogenase, hydrophobic membrane anchor protein [Alphaproteobacteria bacterium]|nr:MAG: succinate dehydrogenase, hydrophobic membrane anchor protein [Alphaproteobacteria bacterium]
MGNGTSIGQVRGHGSAHEGAHHWIVQRYTALGNLTLVSWLIASLLMLNEFSYDALTKWLGHPVNATAMILLVVSTLWHARLGLQVLIEDYIPNTLNRFLVLSFLNMAVFGGGALATLSVLKIALVGGAA